MPVPEGLDSTRPGGLQDPLADDIIYPSEREEVVTVPLYGIVHDSPVITAGQIAVRKLRKKNVASARDAELVTELLSPILNRIQEAIDKNNKNKK